MSRRSKKGRGKKNHAIPTLATMPILIPAIQTYGAVGLSKAFPEYMLWQTTGYSVSDKAFNTGILTRQAMLVLLSLVGHKVANRTGVNRMARKLTMGYLEL